ncbi:Rpn family recombination-promoting nuclease/putative transposase [Candidatus Babeliales bacterium]|nr:Rpn family recombination-promoting nuclease/putative transposase [Candidatus Babeliales bacterium]
MKFLDPKIDLAFKKLFGSEDHKRVTISFLNTMLEYTDDQCIETIQFLNNEQLPVSVDKKENILDIFCTDRSGRKFIIEMQNAWMRAFGSRIVYYGAKTYTNQLGKGMPYDDLSPVTVVAITQQFEVFPNKLNHKSIHYLVDSKTYEHDLDDLTFVFIELPKFTKKEHELVTNEDKWLFLLKEIGFYNHIPGPLNQAEFGEACQLLNQITLSDSEQAAYERKLIDTRAREVNDYLAMNAAEYAERARLEGLEKGIEKGRMEAQREAAKKMLARGLDLETIAAVTLLAVDEISELKKLIFLPGHSTTLD